MNQAGVKSAADMTADDLENHYQLEAELEAGDLGSYFDGKVAGSLNVEGAVHMTLDVDAIVLPPEYADRRYTNITEAAKLLDEATSAIRYWSGLLKLNPLRRSGRRQFNPLELKKLVAMKLLRRTWGLRVGMAARLIRRSRTANGIGGDS